MIHHSTSGTLISNQQSGICSQHSQMKYGFGPFHPGSPPKDMPGPKKNLGMVTRFLKDFAKLFYIALPCFTICNNSFHHCLSHRKWPRTSNDSNDNWGSPIYELKVCAEFWPLAAHSRKYRKQRQWGDWSRLNLPKKNPWAERHLLSARVLFRRCHNYSTHIWSICPSWSILPHWIGFLIFIT